MMRSLLVPLLLGLLVGCKEDGTTKDDSGSPESPSGLSFWPPEAGRGTSFDARITASSSMFDYEDTTLDLGAGVTVNSVTVLDGWTATANLTVAGDAALGARDVTVHTGTSSGTMVIGEGLTIVDDSFTINPSRARIGESVMVEFIGQNTTWTPGATWAWFGDDIEVQTVEILSESYALAEVTVGRDAAPGLYDVAMETGPDVTTLYNGFQVDRVALSATFDPKQAMQGQTVDFTIDGVGTHFSADSELSFWAGGDEKGDILVDWVNVIDAEHLYGQMTLSNAAEIGWRDVLVQTDDEGVFIEDAFEVLDGEDDLTNVGISLWFYVVRGIDNATGDLYESVQGGVIFYIPLDPPCGASSSGSGPQPYDVNGVFPDPPPVEEPDCPSPQTVSAGDHVWFESPCNVVQLDKYVDGASGMIYYTADLTLDDYCFDQIYDLHTQGEEGAIGEYILEEVQPTVPADWEILTPQLWGNFTQPRSEDFRYTWTPAQTYPDAIFVTGIHGTLVATGEGGFAGSVPWDDGDHTYTPAELSQLEAGNVSFYAYSYIEGRKFGFPFSTIQDNQSSSYVYLGASMVLE